jgi:hypothetical protein
LVVLPAKEMWPGLPALTASVRGVARGDRREERRAARDDAQYPSCAIGELKAIVSVHDSS